MDALVGRLRVGALVAIAVMGTLVMLAPTAANAAPKKKLTVRVASNSQTQVQNQGALKVSYRAKGLKKLSATAKATPEGGSQVNFASKATKKNPKDGTLSLPLTGAGEAALADCASLRVRVQAKGKPSKNATAQAVLAEDDPECARPVREFELLTSASYPLGITVGPDDALWFTESGANPETLGRITTDGEYSRTEIPVPPGTPAGGFGGHLLDDVVTGPDGALWASPLAADGVRRIDPATGSVTSYPAGIFGDSRIAAGSDGNLWVTAGGALKRITTSGDVTDFPVAGSPYQVAPGPDGTVWYTSNGVPGVGRLDPDTGESELFELDAFAAGITADRGGRLWFTSPLGNTIGRIDPTSEEIVEFEVPTADAKPLGIAFADDGSIWFTEMNSDNIGRYDPGSGAFTEYPLETQGSVPFDITEGPDGRIWFTEAGSGRVGRLDPSKAPVAEPNVSNSIAAPAFAEAGRCPTSPNICQQQVSTGGVFKIGDELTQNLPPRTLTLTAGIELATAELIPPASGPMLESRPLDVEVGGQQAVTRVGLAGPPHLVSLTETIVPIDLYVKPVGSTEGGCVIGPIVQDLVNVEDEEGDMGAIITGDSMMFGGVGSSNEPALLTGPGTLADHAFTVPEARGCGPLTEVINNLLDLPSPSGENDIVLPYSRLLTQVFPATPSANAGADQTVGSGATVQLDGTGSGDPDNQELTYSWTQISGPEVTLEGAATATPTFTAPPQPATLEFELEVCDTEDLCVTDTVTVNVGNPTADAGPGQAVRSEAAVTLDATASSDPEGDSLTFTWTQVDGPTVTLTGADTATPTFTAPAGPANLTFQVEVCDPNPLCATSQVSVSVLDPGTPFADAGPDQTVASEAPVQLDGTASSDPDSDPLTYSWFQTAGPTVTLDGADTATPSFTAPVGPESLEFGLQVCDAANCDTDQVAVTVDAPGGG